MQHFRSEINRSSCFNIKDKQKDCLCLKPCEWMSFNQDREPTRKVPMGAENKFSLGICWVRYQDHQEDWRKIFEAQKTNLGHQKKKKKRQFQTRCFRYVEKSPRILISSFRSTLKWPLMNLPDNLTLSKLSLGIYLVLAVRLNYHLCGSPLDYSNSELLAKASISVFLIASS